MKIWILVIIMQFDSCDTEPKVTVEYQSKAECYEALEKARIEGPHIAFCIPDSEITTY